jgi:uncharacterized protein Gcw-chp
MRARLTAVCGLGLVTAAWAGPAAAQVTVGADAPLLSGYVWRGVTYSNKPVVQPDVWVNLKGLTLGAWANVELAKYDGSNDISENGGNSAGVAEVDFWAEYARTTANVSWKLGWIIYVFDMNDPPPAGRFGLYSAFDTHEFYGQASVSGLPVTPTLYVSYDADKVNGLYVQPSVSYGWKAAPKVTINLTGLAGFSGGQGVSPDDFAANFAENGLTHVDLSASTSFAAGPVSIAPSFHFQISHDAFAKANGAEVNNQDKDVKLWAGVGLSWSRALNRAPER